MIIRKGDRGEEVKKIQSSLGLTADGIFGSGTEEAVKQFQKQNNLDVDGLVGPSTLDMLLEEPEAENINLSSLSGHVPDSVIEELPKTMETFKINTKLRLAHFLSQVAHESGNFKFIEENLNYSDKALLAVFGKYFDEELAEEYHRQPEKIANRVYANRMENGNEDSGEGWKFRGRGYIQLTGKHNYSLFNEYVDEDVIETPDTVSEQYPLLSAGWFWFENGLNRVADTGSDDEVVKKITRRVNGGYNGLEDRLHHFKEFLGLI